MYRKVCVGVVLLVYIALITIALNSYSHVSIFKNSQSCAYIFVCYLSQFSAGARNSVDIVSYHNNQVSLLQFGIELWSGDITL